MKHLIAAVLCGALASCTTTSPEVDLAPAQPTVSADDIRNDNHCRGLLMQPGTFVYVQCRLAMDGTQLRLERQARARLETIGGPLPTEVENTMRADVICNFNEASKLSQQFGDARQLGFQAQSKCQRSRGVLGNAVATWLPGRFDALTAYDAATAEGNVAVIEEARAFPRGVPGAAPGAAPGQMGPAGSGAGAQVAAPGASAYPPPGGVGAGLSAGVNAPPVPMGQLPPMRTY